MVFNLDKFKGFLASVAEVIIAEVEEFFSKAVIRNVDDFGRIDFNAFFDR